MKRKHLVAIGAGVAATAAIIALAPGHDTGVLPNTSITPGAINTSITQENLDQTLCDPQWSTKSERPPSNYTTALKIKQITQYGFSDTKTADYEEDHLISLELGGNPTNPKNLWPEAYAGQYGAKVKDTVENWLHSRVCAGALTLSEAQKEISTNWIAVYKQMKPTFGSVDTSDPDDDVLQ